MQHKLVQLPGFSLIGIELRTTNAREMEAREIPLLWQRFMKDRIMDRIPRSREPGTIYGAYLDYESDMNGAYTLVLGASINGAVAPEGMVKKSLPASRYAVFPIAGMEGVRQAWMEVWNSALDRTYTGDFERYQGDVMELFIAVR